MLAEDFVSKRPVYVQLANELARLLTQLAEKISVSAALIEKRAKTQESFEEKIARPEKAGKYSSLGDITDLCGVRIVLFTDDDCQKMISAIRDNFDIDGENSVVKSFTDEDRLDTNLLTSLLLSQNLGSLYLTGAILPASKLRSK